jgi:hypothetical protein
MSVHVQNHASLSTWRVHVHVYMSVHVQSHAALSTWRVHGPRCDSPRGHVDVTSRRRHVHVTPCTRRVHVTPPGSCAAAWRCVPRLLGRCVPRLGSPRSSLLARLSSLVSPRSSLLARLSSLVSPRSSLLARLSSLSSPPSSPWISSSSESLTNAARASVHLSIYRFINQSINQSLSLSRACTSGARPVDVRHIARITCITHTHTHEAYHAHTPRQGAYEQGTYEQGVTQGRALTNAHASNC